MILMDNQTIHTLMNHRTIRDFSDRQLDQATVNTLLAAASQTATSMFMQQFSVISITESSLKHTFAEITGDTHAEKNGHLFIFIADQYRNYQIGQASGQSTKLLGEADRLLAAIYDASIAAESLTTAAESIGLGASYLGSILNEPQQLVDLLHLPTLTFPVFGVAVGYPVTIPEQKPRLPLTAIHFTNQYHLPDNYSQLLDNYDHELTDYYNQRSTNSRVETFRHNIMRQLAKSPKQRRTVLKVLRKQGFLLDEQ